MNEYISRIADQDLPEIIGKLRSCEYAVIDNDCIYFTSDGGDTNYEVTMAVCNQILLTLLGIKPDEEG